jgi:hypothetical protein
LRRWSPSGSICSLLDQFNSRLRRLLDHLESLGLIVIREEFGGGRSVLVPGLEAQPATA